MTAQTASGQTASGQNATGQGTTGQHAGAAHVADSTLDAVPALAPLLARSMVPTRRPDINKGLPTGGVSVRGVKQDPARLAAYDRVCGFGVRNEVPATWLHVLTFPLQVWLMGQSNFPFRLAGLIHVSNEMTLLRPVQVGEVLDLSVRPTVARPHRKGTVFDLAGEVQVAGETVWRGTSSYLSTASTMQGVALEQPRLEMPVTTPSQQWRLDADLGRRYAAVSGDANPIHLSSASARAFGQKSAIIHGMWTHARALAALGGSLPATGTVRVQFARPIPLPGKVLFAADPAEDGSRRFAVVAPKDGKPHLVGEVTA